MPAVAAQLPPMTDRNAGQVPPPLGRHPIAAYCCFGTSLACLAAGSLVFAAFGILLLAISNGLAHASWPGLPISRLVGVSEEWRADGTGTRVYWLLLFPLVRRAFVHSTSWWE